MEKFKVSFEANNQQLKAIGTKHASDTYADIEAEFVLGNRWTDMDSVSAVWWNDFTRVATVLDSQGKCIVPHEVLTRKGCVRVNLVGSIVEGDELVTRLTSYSAEAVQVNEKIKLTGNEPQSITPSQYEQFVQNVKADADRAEAGATASANSADEAEASAQNASESASASAVSASDSARSATASAGYAQNASEIAVEVEVMKNEVELAKDKVLGMRATAETLEAGSDATASYSDGLLTLGIPRGDQGIQGIQGETGATPNLTIGTVETLAPTEDATATITGTAEEPVLNLGIPKGDTGEVSRAELDNAVSDLKSDINEISEPMKNLICGWLPNAITGNNTEHTGVVSTVAGTSLFFKCEQGKTYTFSTSGTPNRYVWAFFPSLPSVGDATNYFYNTLSVETFTAPISGYGVRYVKNSSDSTFMGNSQFEEGSIATTYEVPTLSAIDKTLRESLKPALGNTRNLIVEAKNARIVATTSGVGMTSAVGTTLIFPVEVGKKYTFQTKSTNVNRYIWAFFSDYPKVNDITSNYINGVGDTIFTVTSPIDGYCARFACIEYDSDMAQYSQIQEGEAQTAYVENGFTAIDLDARADLNMIRNPHGAKKILTIGDSLTNAKGNGAVDGNRWQNQVTQILGLDGFISGGTSGATVANINSLSIYLSVMSMVAEADADIITFWGGTNDYTNGVVIGDFETQLNTATRDVTTFYGAVIACVEKIIDTYPNKRIVMIGTTPRTYDNATGKNYHNTSNGQGKYLSDYVDAFKTVAEYYGLPFLDLLRSGGINERNIDQYLYEQTSGGLNYYLHFSNVGMIKIGNRIGAFLKSIG